MFRLNHRLNSVSLLFNVAEKHSVDSFQFLTQARTQIALYSLLRPTIGGVFKAKFVDVFAIYLERPSINVRPQVIEKHSCVMHNLIVQLHFYINLKVSGITRVLLSSWQFGLCWRRERGFVHSNLFVVIDSGFGCSGDSTASIR